MIILVLNSQYFFFGTKMDVNKQIFYFLSFKLQTIFAQTYSFMKNYIAFICFVILSVFSNAQEKIDTVIIHNNGTLKIELDERINQVISIKEKTSCPVVVKKVVEKKETRKASASDPCAYQTQLNGFKIQIYYSKNRAEADKVKNEFERSYPNLSAQVVCFAPDYRVLVGDYFTKSSAAPDIRKLRSKYNSSFAIPYKVLCRRAK